MRWTLSAGIALAITAGFLYLRLVGVLARTCAAR